MNKHFIKLYFKVKATTTGGFSLVEILIGLAISSTLVLGVGNVIASWGQLQQRQNLTSIFNQNRINVQNAINSDIAWQKTTNLNPTTMSCLSSSGGCGAVVAPQVFNLVDATGAPVIYNGSNGYTGYNLNGSLCVSSCPIQLVLTWKPQCNLVVDPGCKVPFIKITGTYSATSLVTGALNWDKYNFQLMKHQ